MTMLSLYFIVLKLSLKHTLYSVISLKKRMYVFPFTVA